jgi:hypothetical protein
MMVSGVDGGVIFFRIRFRTTTGNSVQRIWATEGYRSYWFHFDFLIDGMLIVNAETAEMLELNGT